MTDHELEMQANPSRPAKTFDLKNTGPFTPKEAAQRLMLASQQLKGFQLWHPHLHVAYLELLLEKIKYPIPSTLIPKGVVVSIVNFVSGEGRSPQTVSGYVEPFRKALKKLASAANISMSAVLFETTNQKCPSGVHAIRLVADQGKELRLQAQYLHATPTPPANAREKVLSHLGTGIGGGWNLVAGDDFLVFPRNVRRAQSSAETTIPPSRLNTLEADLTELFKINGQPKAVNWMVRFDDPFRRGDGFYRRILDKAGRWYHFPRTEILKATGLRGDIMGLFQEVNKLGFSGKTARARFDTSFETLENAHSFFELAVRGREIDRRALAMFQTEKGILAQLCFGTNRAGKIIFKVLYPQRGGFGWEDAYEKLQRGEKLL